jgi:hypothetical protein
MPHFRARLVPVLVCTALLLGAATIGAFAATGGPLLLGKSNIANKTTKLKTTGNGPALKLKSKAGKPPFAVSNKTKIKKLNADLVDGLEGDALKTKSFIYTVNAPTTTENFVVFQLPGLPAGRYHVSYSISAAIAGGPPSFFGCFLLTGSGVAIDAQVVALGSNGGGGLWVVSGSGPLDTTAATYRLACQMGGGTSMTIPGLAQFPARVVFTRLDDVTNLNSTGTGSTAPRSLARGLAR